MEEDKSVGFGEINGTTEKKQSSECVFTPAAPTDNPLIQPMLSSSYHQRFSGISRLYGKRSYAKLACAHFMVMGLGGVGSWSVEALARSGVGKLTLVDLDDICITNSNRQIHAVVHTIGRQKTDVLKERVLEINPEIECQVVSDFYTTTTSREILSLKPDVVIDAFDSLKSKAHLIATCLKQNIPLVVSGGAGGRVDPTSIRCSDLLQTTNDKMLRSLRVKLKKEYGVVLDRSQIGIPTVYSTERPVYPTSSEEVSLEPEVKNFGLDCKGGLGASCFVTGTFGFVAASRALDLYFQSFVKVQ